MDINVKWDYKIGNRKVSQREWERHIFQDAPRQLAREQIESKLRGVRCPTHGEAPRLQFTDTSKGFEIEISGCCEELEALAEQVLDR